MKPSYIRSRVDFDAAVVLGRTTETAVLEFKSALDAGPRWQQELCRDVAQLANTWGGCLLLGVGEHLDPGTNLRVAQRIDGIAKPDDTRGRIEKAMVNHLVPSTISSDITHISLAQGTVLAVNIQPSVNLVYVWDRSAHTIECLRRTSHGKEWMNPNEMEMHIMNGSRRAVILLDQIELGASIELILVDHNGITTFSRRRPYRGIDHQFNVVKLENGPDEQEAQKPDWHPLDQVITVYRGADDVWRLKVRV